MCFTHPIKAKVQEASVDSTSNWLIPPLREWNLLKLKLKEVEKKGIEINKKCEPGKMRKIRSEKQDSCLIG